MAHSVELLFDANRPHVTLMAAPRIDPGVDAALGGLATGCRWTVSSARPRCSPDPG